MSKINDGGPDDRDLLVDLRDYFASAAMAAIIAKLPLRSTNPVEGVPPAEAQSVEVRNAAMRMVAVGAYGYADAMLAARDLTEAAS